jgi:hypothetical protein
MKLKWVAVFILMAGAVGFFWESSPDQEIPDQLLGIWRTLDSPYADCYLEITPDTIVFGVDNHHSTSNMISEVSETVQNKKRLHTIGYRDETGGAYHLSLYFDPMDGGCIIFKNQPNIQWYPEEDLMEGF